MPLSLHCQAVTIKNCPDIAQCPLGGVAVPTENHCLRPSFQILMLPSHKLLINYSYLFMMTLVLEGGGGDIPHSGIFGHFSQLILIHLHFPCYLLLQPGITVLIRLSASFPSFLSPLSTCTVDNCNLEDAPLNLCPLPPLKAPAQFNKANTVMANQLIRYMLKCNVFFKIMFIHSFIKHLSKYAPGTRVGVAASNTPPC